MQVGASIRRPQRAILCLFAAASLLCPTPGFSQPSPSPAEAALAKRAFPDAQQLLESEYKARPAPELLRLLGDAALGRQQLWLAASLYLEYQRAVPDLAAELKSRQAQVIAEAEQTAVRVFVNYPQDEQEASLLRIDQRLVGSLPLRGWLLLPPGEHKLELPAKRGGPALSVSLPASAAPKTIAISKGSLKPLILEGVTVQLVGSFDAVAERAARERLLQAVVQGTENNLVVALPPMNDAPKPDTKPGATLPCKDSPDCVAQRLSKTGTSYALLFDHGAPAQPGATAEVRLRLFDAGACAVSAEAQVTCPGCKEAALLSEVRSVAQKLVKQGLDARVHTASLASTPPGVPVRVAGCSRGTTPLGIGLLPGRSRISLRLRGYLPVDQVVEVAADAPPDSLSYKLALEPDPDARLERRLTPAKWTLFGAGLLGVAAGAALLPFDGYQSCGDPAAEAAQLCPEQLLTKPFAIAALVGGGVALTGSLILWLGERKVIARQKQRLAWDSP